MNVRTFVAICREIRNMIFRKWGGRVKGRLELFRKFIRFDDAICPMKQSLSDREKWRKIKEEKLGLYCQINVLNYKC